MNIQFLTREQYLKTVAITFVVSMLIVTAAAFLGRATLNLKAALTTMDKPDIAVMLLMGDKDVESSVLLRDSESSRDYLVETKEEGPQLVTLKKGETTWYVSEKEVLRR